MTPQFYFITRTGFKPAPSDLSARALFVKLQSYTRHWIQTCDRLINFNPRALWHNVRFNVFSLTTRVAGFEPAHEGVKVLCLTAWLYPIKLTQTSWCPGHCPARIVFLCRLVSLYG